MLCCAQVAVGIVTACEATLLSMNDFEQMINYLRQDVPLWSKLALHDLLTDALRWAGIGSGAGWAGPGRSGVKGCGPGWGRFRGWGLHTLPPTPPSRCGASFRGSF